MNGRQFTEERTWKIMDVAMVNGNFKTLFYSEISKLFRFCVMLVHKVDLNVRLNAFKTDELDATCTRKEGE